MVTVRRGDSLSSLAERELGSSARWPELFRVNRAQLDDPDELAVGTRLVLPEPQRKRTADAWSQSHDRQRRSEKSQPEHDRPAAQARDRPRQPSMVPPPDHGFPTEPSGAAPNGAADRESTVDRFRSSLAGVGGLLAAGVLSGLAWRRRVQLQTRPIGRRIVHPPTPPVRLRSRSGDGSGR